jgi:hypothetical protein
MRSAFWVLFLTSLTLAAPKPPYAGLPDGAVLLEQEPLPIWAHPHRALVLWVLAPADKPLEDQSLLGEGDTEYTCADLTTGHFYLAPTRVSLVDTQSMQVRNTAPVMLTAIDQYPIPFWIRSGFVYEVPGQLKQGSGKPHILALQDFNGDGKALEFAFYVMESSNGPLTMVMGYSERQDRVIVYEFVLQDKSSDKPAVAQSWMYRFAAQRPIAPMHWQYSECYNSGWREEWDFRYIPDRERFEGTTLKAAGCTDLREPRKKE